MTPAPHMPTTAAAAAVRGEVVVGGGADKKGSSMNNRAGNRANLKPPAKRTTVQKALAEMGVDTNRVVEGMRIKERDKERRHEKDICAWKLGEENKTRHDCTLIALYSCPI